jgi:arginyl-tRNA synthetase
VTDPLLLVSLPIADAAIRLGAEEPAEVGLEQPADEARGDYATTLALRLARPLRQPPRQLAEELRAAALTSPWVATAEIAGAGFLNLRLSPAWYAAAIDAARDPGFGGGTARERLRVNVEFVSANPTGPLTVGSARNAAYGDCIARALAFAGHDVTREYYFNDSGSQVERFGRSLRARARGEEVPPDGYPGEEVAELARRLPLAPDEPVEEWARLGVEAMFAEIRGTLERFRVHMDVWTNEADLHASGKVQRALDAASAAGHVFEADDALWLRTTAFGDDKDRVIVRGGGSPTYFAADLGYLVDKLERGYDRALYVLGSDHHGYTARLRGAAAALGYDPERVEVPLYQLVSILDGGEARKISKRRGDIVLLDELVDAIGVDAARFFLVQRSHDQTIELDLELAREQGPKNPVYYVQYAHARIASIVRRAAQENAGEPVTDPELAPEPTEAALVRRLADFPGVCEAAAALRAPHRVIAYAHDLASDFHLFYHHCSVIHAPEPRIVHARLALCEAARSVLERCLDLVGVSAPDEM